jgi:hypothetical protein
MARALPEPVPGTYRLEVELTAFQRYVRDGIAVNVHTAPRIEERCSWATCPRRFGCR